MLMFIGILALIPKDKPECVVGYVELSDFGAIIVIGEAVVCGEFHSDIYGPTLEAWSGEIKFYHRHEDD